jgi:hypothetical protein
VFQIRQGTGGASAVEAKQADPCFLQGMSTGTGAAKTL